MDVPFLLALRRATMTEYLLKAGFKINDDYHLARINEAFQDSLLIKLENDNIGLLKLSKQSDRLHIRQLQILPEFQNKGIGGRVIDVVIKKAKQLGLPVTLNVLLNNPAQKLYLAKGFQVIGETDIEYQMQYSLD